MLARLREAGKYYRFYDDYESYKKKCRTDDPVGHDIMFNVEKEQ